MTASEHEEKLGRDFVLNSPQFIGQINLVRTLTNHPVLPGNNVRILENGDEAFPAMLAAIRGAKKSISLLSYIFDADKVGLKFYEALVEAHTRGVKVKVLIDDVGSRYSQINMINLLRKAGISTAAFLPTRVPLLLSHVNMRNHRKILVVDGILAFTGGTNIREGHWLAKNPTHPAACLHFQFAGPVVGHIQKAFAIDWAFTTTESLLGDEWFPALEHCGATWCRGVAHGPDEDFEKITYTLIGAIAAARKEVSIVTPYFVPDSNMIYILQVAAMKGVTVNIILPSENNIKLVGWACEACFNRLLSKGCRIFVSPRPFDHTKLMVVDGVWSFMGSTNWDSRSLRLNFEFNVECYDEALAGQLAILVKNRINAATEITLEGVDAWTLSRRLRNGFARLFSPLL